MKPSSAKAKGRILQQLVAKTFADKYNLTYGFDEDVGSREMGQRGTDIKLSPRARCIIQFDIECKNGKSISFWRSWEQTVTNTKEGRTPLLVMKRNRQEPLAVLRFDYLMELLK